MQLHEPFHRTGRALHLAPLLDQRGRGARDEAGVQQELRQLTARHLARQHGARAQPQHERDRGHHQRRAERREQRAHLVAAHRQWRSSLPRPRDSGGVCSSSSVKAWMVCMALSVSPAMPLESATRSCESRDSLRTFRPTVNSGSMISGISTTMMPMSRGLVQPISTSAPSRFSVERSVIEMPTPEMDCTSVVSVVSRDSTSPVRVISKKVMSMRTTRS